MAAWPEVGEEVGERHGRELNSQSLLRWRQRCVTDVREEEE